jgi:hypothetical protein
MEKKKDKNKMRGLKAKVYAMAFCFADQDAKECVIMFRIYVAVLLRGELSW